MANTPGTAIPDFSVLPNRSDSMTALRRYDLATLRQLVRSESKGVEDGDLIGKDSRTRLVAHGMAERRLVALGHSRNFATEHGSAAVKANASCVDGSEGYAR